MFLEIENINKSFGDESVVIDLNVSLEQHKTLSILGKSGCGKTTMLKIIAGLVVPDSGSLSLDGRSMLEVEPAKRNIVYLYQIYCFRT